MNYNLTCMTSDLIGRDICTKLGALNNQQFTIPHLPDPPTSINNMLLLMSLTLGTAKPGNNKEEKGRGQAKWAEVDTSQSPYLDEAKENLKNLLIMVILYGLRNLGALHNLDLCQSRSRSENSPRQTSVDLCSNSSKMVFQSDEMNEQHYRESCVGFHLKNTIKLSRLVTRSHDHVRGCLKREVFRS